MNLYYYIKMTLKIQPAVIFFCLISVLSKVAAGLLPHKTIDTTILQYFFCLVTAWKFLGVVMLMFLSLAVYAVIWQRLIKNVKIAVVYANKSSSILWSQLAAIVIFGERLSWNNVLGICMIFTGIMLANAGER